MNRREKRLLKEQIRLVLEKEGFMSKLKKGFSKAKKKLTGKGKKKKGKKKKGKKKGKENDPWRKENKRALSDFMDVLYKHGPLKVRSLRDVSDSYKRGIEKSDWGPEEVRVRLTKDKHFTDRKNLPIWIKMIKEMRLGFVPDIKKQYVVALKSAFGTTATGNSREPYDAWEKAMKNFKKKIESERIEK